jgi:two-component system sensor histidine kinase ChiS
LWDSLQNNVVTYLWLLYISGVAIILFRGVRDKNRDAIIMLVSFFVLLAAMLLDILSGRAIINLPPLLTYVFILFILSMALVLANRFVRLHDETEKLNEDLSRFNQASRRFVPFEFLEMLDKNSITDVSLGDQVQRDMAILFSDIRSFTALSEKMSPKENFDFINSYLDRVGPVIRQHNGFIDKYIGDAVMALFPRSAQDALDAALAMHAKVADWNARRRVHGYEPVAIGIGVHWGRVMLGTIGEHERMDGTVISDAVNLASRIESLTKQYGAGVLISSIAWEQISQPGQYKWRVVDRVVVKGKNVPVELIEVFNTDEPVLQRTKELSRDSFVAAASLYQAGRFHEAKTAFLSLIAANSADRVFRLYLERVERHLAQPPAEWRGFEILTEK